MKKLNSGQKLLLQEIRFFTRTEFMEIKNVITIVSGSGQQD